jgi:hypothetical protein
MWSGLIQLNKIKYTASQSSDPPDREAVQRLLEKVKLDASAVNEFDHPLLDTPIESVYNTEYNEPGPFVIETLTEFAKTNNFTLNNCEKWIGKIKTVRDVIKFHRKICEIAKLKKNDLFYIIPNIEIPNSLSVVEGLFAVQAFVDSKGDPFYLFKQKYGQKQLSAIKKEYLKTRNFQVFIFQNDNYLSATNSDPSRLRQQLKTLVDECPVCFEPFVDAHVIYPFKCNHGIHHLCYLELTPELQKQCITCASTKKVKYISEKVS